MRDAAPTLAATEVRVAVVGAGVIGVTSAYELARDGHRVTVYERCASAAAETSFANAGIVAPGYVTPWAAPGMPGKVLRHLFTAHAPVRVHANLNLAWALRWLRACGPAVYPLNRRRMHRLAVFSRERLHEIAARLGIDYERSDGFLVLLRARKDLDLARPGIDALAAIGTRVDVLDPADCRRVEPGLSAATPLHAGLHLPDDEVGNCRQFTLMLRREAEALGVEFQFNRHVERLVPGRPARLMVRSGPAADARPLRQGQGLSRIAPIPQSSGPEDESFDAVVICAALGARPLLRACGVHVPMQAVYGYSMTAPLRHADAAAECGWRSALMDERHKVAISRIGSRLRVSGSAEIGGRADRHDPRAIATLYRVLDDWFLGAAQTGQAQHWKGARPMLPDGPPVIGRTPADGIWINLGHGSSGWALACGSARLLADAVAGKPASIDSEGLGLERFTS